MTVYQRQKATILIVDDDKSDRLFAKQALEEHGYCIFEAMNGRRVDEIIQDHAVDIILLDLKLPGESGINLIGSIRHRTNAPIIIISGIQNVADKKTSLDNGADDYMTKPFIPEELQARITANLRRYHDSTYKKPDNTKVKFGPWIMDPAHFDIISDNNQAGALTVQEYRLLKKLVMAQGRILPRDELSDHATKRGIDVQIARIRKKLNMPDAIQTIRGIGYRFTVQTEIIHEEGE